MAPPKGATRRPPRAQKRQTRLRLSPLHSSSAAKGRCSTAVRDRLTDVRYDGPDYPSPRQESSDGVYMLPTPGPSSRLPDVSSSPLSDAPPSTPDKRPASESVQDEDVDDDEIVPSSKRRRTALRDSAHETPVRRSGRLQNTSPPRPSTSIARSSEAFSHVEVSTPTRRASGLSDIGSAETSDEDALVTQPTQRRRKVGNDTYQEFSKPSRSKGIDDWLADDDEIEYVSSDENQPKVPKVSKPRTPRQRSRKEQEELDADLEDLRDSEQEKSARKRRTRGGPVTTKRDKAREHLEVLRRRRAWEKVPRIIDYHHEEDEDGVDISFIGLPTQISDEGSLHSSVDTKPEPEEDGEEDEEDDFIEDDTTGRLGRPHREIPLEFTQFASAKPRELFPHIVEWLVKNKLAPAFKRDDALYKLAFDRVDDQVTAQAGSRLISAAWNATFKYSILARPQISIGALPGMDEDLVRTCDACNKTNRPARYDFVLSGDAYHKNSLEPVDYDEDEEEDDVQRDEGGHQLATQSQHFYLGSHCAANAQMGHKLTHWKYHLNESVLAYLEDQGVLSAEAIIARDKMNQKKRDKEAEAVVDSMEETGKIEELWRSFQNDLDDARLGMEDFEKRGGRSHGRIGVIRTVTDGRVREWRESKYKETVRLDSDSEGN